MSSNTYKVFPIDWKGELPRVEDSKYLDAVPVIGCRIYSGNEKYRIFGFTDMGCWWAEGDKYSHHSCNLTGNRQYAMGRLEE